MYAQLWDGTVVVDLIPRKVDPNGRVVLPPEVLKILDVKVGDYIGYELARDRVVLHKVRIERAGRGPPAE